MEKKYLNLAGRYVVLLLLGLNQLKLFYLIFTPLTVYPVFWVLSLVDNSSRLLEGNLIFFSGFYAQIIPACVAGAAYYLLFILNLTTPMKVDQRVKSLSFLLLSFLFLNVLRILVFASLLANGSQYFDLAHNVVWYFGSTVMVIVIWFVNVWFFKIRAIPIYSDVKEVFGEVVGKKSKRKK